MRGNYGKEASLSAYPDADAISDWAVDQMAWAVEAGIYETDSDHLYPQAFSKRYQIAEILCVFAEKFC